MQKQATKGVLKTCFQIIILEKTVFLENIKWCFLKVFFAFSLRTTKPQKNKIKSTLLCFLFVHWKQLLKTVFLKRKTNVPAIQRSCYTSKLAASVQLIRYSLASTRRKWIWEYRITTERRSQKRKDMLT